MLALIQEKKKKKGQEKVVLQIYLPTVRLWTMDTGNFTNIECSCFCKRRTSIHKVIWSLAFRSGGDMLYNGLNTKRKKKLFF